MIARCQATKATLSGDARLAAGLAADWNGGRNRIAVADVGNP
jgi:hypothetical protein